MTQPKLSKLELQILEALWAHGKASIREIQEAFPEPRPAYTTIQTTVYRPEGEKAVRRVRKIWQSTLFAFGAGLLTAAFRKNRAKVRYWLWFSASLKFFIPFSLLIGLGSQLGQTPVAQKHATPAVSFAMARITQPFPGPMSFTPPQPVATNWTPIAILGVWASGFVAITLMRLRAWLRIRAGLRSRCFAP